MGEGLRIHKKQILLFEERMGFALLNDPGGFSFAIKKIEKVLGYMINTFFLNSEEVNKL